MPAFAHDCLYRSYPNVCNGRVRVFGTYRARKGIVVNGPQLKLNDSGGPLAALKPAWCVPDGVPLPPFQAYLSCNGKLGLRPVIRAEARAGTGNHGRSLRGGPVGVTVQWCGSSRWENEVLRSGEKQSQWPQMIDVDKFERKAGAMN